MRILLMCLFPTLLSGQSSWSRSRCDYNLFRPMSEDYLGRPAGSFGTFTAPRIIHHSVKAGLSVGIAAGARKLGMPRKAAAIVGLIGSGVAFHVVGRATHKYHEINWPDWTFDASVASLPLAQECGWRGISTYAASYAILVCYGSP